MRQQSPLAFPAPMATLATSAPRWTRLEHDERREQILTCSPAPSLA